MSYKSPIEFLITNPVLADKAAQKIQLAMINAPELSWIQIKFGRARIGKKTIKGSLQVYPSTQQTLGRDFISLWPNDNVSSQSFILMQNEEPTSQADGRNTVNWKADCSIIVFVRKLNFIDTSYGANIEQLLRNDLQKVIKTSVPNFTITGWENEIESVYEEFTVESLEPQFINDHKKYAYLRLNGEITYKADCYEQYDYDGTVDFDPLAGLDFIYGGANFLQQP